MKVLGCCPSTAPDVSQTRLDGCWVMLLRLLRAGHLSYQTSSINGVSADVSM